MRPKPKTAEVLTFIVQQCAGYHLGDNRLLDQDGTETSIKHFLMCMKNLPFDNAEKWDQDTSLCLYESVDVDFGIENVVERKYI